MNLDGSIRRSHHLELVPFRRRDSDALLEAVLPSLPELEQWLPWAHRSYSRTDAVQFVRESMRSWREGRAFDFGIRRSSQPDRHLGNVSVWFISRGFRTGEIGYWIRTDETGHGVGCEAAARAVQVGFEEMNLHRIVLRIAVGNRASERIAEKLGFTREGLLREEINVRGRWLDHSAWGLLEHEYRRALDTYAQWLEVPAAR